MSRIASAAAVLLALAAAAPLIAAEALYRYGLHALGPPPALASRRYPSLTVSAFWLDAGERLPRRVDPLSPWRCGWALAYERAALGKPRPGERVATLAARAWLGDRAPSPGPMRALSLWAAAVWASRHLDADQMTQVWMDGAWFGRDARGMEAASSAYFGKAPGDLEIGEMALLVAMTRSPSALSPECAPDRAARARARVLRELLEAGAITPADHALAVAKPLGVLRRRCAETTKL